VRSVKLLSLAQFCHPELVSGSLDYVIPASQLQQIGMILSMDAEINSA